MSFIKRDGREEYTYKMFGYLLMAVLTIAVIVGLYLVTQHSLTHKAQETLDANQQFILNNQKDILTNQKGIETVLNNSQLLLQQGRDHEEREEVVFSKELQKHINQFDNFSKRYIIADDEIENMSDLLMQFYKDYKKGQHRGGYYSNDLGIPPSPSSPSKTK